MTRTKALAKLYKSVSGSATKKVTITAILKELYYALIGEETTKNNIADILSEMADNYEGGSGGGGGGGGSSDFSTAAVTMTNNHGERLYMYFPHLITDDGDTYLDTEPLSVPQSGSGTQTFVLYSGEIGGLIYDSRGSMLLDGISVTGSATVEDGFVLITGDCTITISGSDGGGGGSIV